MKLVVIFLFTLFLILLVLVVKRFYNIDFFDSYEYKFDEDLIFTGGINENVNIGIGTEPKNDSFLSVNGDLVVKDQFCIGDVCLTYDLLKKLNKLPLFTTDNYCLYDSTGNKECIDEDHLKMLTGEKNIIFTDRNNNSLESHEVAHHGRDKKYPYDVGHDGSMDGSLYSGFEIFPGEKNLYFDKGKTHLETLQKQPMDKTKDDQQFRILTFPEEGEVSINYKCYE